MIELTWKTTAIAPAPPGMTATLRYVDAPEGEDQFTVPVLAMLLQACCDDTMTRTVLGVLNPYNGEVEAVPSRGSSFEELVSINVTVPS